jgi:hypothetical protein
MGVVILFWCAGRERVVALTTALAFGAVVPLLGPGSVHTMPDRVQ